MILYQALSSYQILECILHRRFFYPEEKAVLLLGTYIKERMPDYGRIRELGFFDEIFLFRYGGYQGGEEQIAKDVEEELSKTLPYQLSEFERILIAGIHTYLQVYLIRKQITFEMFEDGSGALSRPEVLAEIHQKSAPGRYRILEKYGLYDHSQPLITRKYADFAAQREGFQDEKAVDFSIKEYLGRLESGEKEKLRSLFHVPSLGTLSRSVLLLTQQFANLGQLSFDEQVLIYQNLFDYFLEEEQVLIKPHPDDILYYHRLFSKAAVLREPFPSELLPLAFERLPQTVATISSTGVNQIRGDFQEALCFNALYEKSFHANHRYALGLALMEGLQVTKIAQAGCNEVQLRNFAKRCKGEMEILDVGEDPKDDAKLEGSVLFWDDWSQKEAPFWMADQGKVRGILFLNSNRCFQMYDLKDGIRRAKERFFDLIPVKVVKRKAASDWISLCADYRDTEEEDILYFYSREERMRKMAAEFEYQKTLPRTGAEISIERMGEDEIRIRMLEGILEATEQRLLEYIRKEEER